MARAALATAAVLVACVAALLINPLRLGTRPATPVPDVDALTLPFAALSHRAMIGVLARAIRIPTVSKQHGIPPEMSRHAEFLAFLRAEFPRVWSACHETLINRLGLLLECRGTDASLEPILLLAHYDVVPVDMRDWSVPAFDGVLHDDTLFGRGTIDDKGSIIGILLALDFLMARGEPMPRGVTLAFGHDEELGGSQGGAAIAAHLAARNARFAFVLDEGYFILPDGVPGMSSAPIALLGIGEKKSNTLRVTVNGPSGHGSMPPEKSAVTDVARLITGLQQHPMPADFSSGASMLFERLVPYAHPLPRVIIANLDIFAPLIARVVKMPAAATFRTTMSISRIAGGIADNVVAPSVSFIVDSRILPTQEADMVAAHILGVAARLDVNATVEILEPPTPRTLASPDSAAFELVARSVRQASIVATNDDLPVLPALVIATTDARHYESLSRNVFRLAPMRVSAEERTGLHGFDERIKVPVFAETVTAYALIIRNAQSSAAL